MNKRDSTDAYATLIAKLKKRRRIAAIASLLIFGSLLWLSSQGLVQTHWFIFLLLSFSVSGWLLLLSRLISWLLFLRPRMKNQPKSVHDTYPVKNAIKKARQTLLIATVVSGLLFFSLLLLWMLKPDDDGAMTALRFSDVMTALVFSVFVALANFVLMTVFPAFIFRIELIPKSSRNPHSGSSLAFGNDLLFSTDRKPEQPEMVDVPAQMRENWDHDPMNPASAEYQSTYRRWWHQEDFHFRHHDE